MGEPKNIEDNPEVLAQPSWLNTALIERALHNAGDENSIVAEMSVIRGSAIGDNYGSIIYRVKATLSDGRHRSLIVKGPVPGAALTEFNAVNDTFTREVEMLTKVIPQMEALLDAAAPGRFPPLAPRCYLHDASPVAFVVLEDLGPQGFRLGDRKRGLGLRHCLLVLRSLARFHAASHALLQREPRLAERLDNTWKLPNPAMQVYMDGCLQKAAEAVRDWPGFEKYARAIDKFKLNAMETFRDLNKAIPGEFNVILHGDFWVNNFMFQYVDGEPMNLRCIDLQQSHVASPAIDLLHFMASSVSEDVHTRHQDLLLREYHFALKETLELLGIQAPSLESLLSAFEAHGMFSLFMTIGGFPIMKTGTADVNAMFAGDHSCLPSVFQHPVVKKWWQRLLPDYARRGWLPV